ncbi:uncharacterized protein LOC125491162 isoform X2 [Plutella xylostella]|nr:uncharacterized protein LOC125491162 isoform X2 [Plutella xylostella]
MSEPQPGASGTAPPAPPPVKKRKLAVKKQLSQREKKFLVNIYNHLEKTSPTYPSKMELYKTTSKIMDVSEYIVRDVMKHYTQNQEVPQPKERPANRAIIDKLDDFILSAIRRKVHKFYYDGELPTIAKIFTAVNEDDSLPNFTFGTMYRILKKLNFTYCKRSRKSILLDRPDLQIWRVNYLLKINEYREQNKKIYYLDETWLNEGHTCNYVWMDNDIKSSRQAFLGGLSSGLKNPQKGKRLIITHIGNEDGFLEGADWVFEAKKSDGDYHGEMDAHNFEKWFKMVLDKILPGSVIVMDNAPYHSRQLERVPNMSWRKDAIQEWLRSKNIAFETREIKAQLLTKFDKKKYVLKYVDELAASKGVTVLRLPPYHCELNPIELIWAQVKSYVGRNNKSFKMAEIKTLLNEGFARIGAKQWSKCVNHVLKEEEELKKLDGILDTTSDDTVVPLIIAVTGDTSDSDDDEDEDLNL